MHDFLCRGGRDGNRNAHFNMIDHAIGGLEERVGSLLDRSVVEHRRTAFPGRTIQALSILCLMAAPAPGTSPVIKPGEIWRDGQGRHIQAHGGGILAFAAPTTGSARNAGRSLTPPGVT
jgi:hypothetical protein